MKRLVVLRALKLGDLMTAIPALRALGDAFSGHRRILATPKVFEPLVRCAGLADEVVDASGLAPLQRSLAGPDVAVDLHGRGPGSQPLLVALRPRRLIAFAHPEVPATAGGPQWRPGEHEVARWCRLLEESGIPADPARLDIDPPAVGVPAWLRGATIIHPGAASAARRWPAERFAEVARAEAAMGRAVAVTGTADELGLASEVAAQAGLPPVCVLAGRTDLLSLVALVGAAGRVVSGDTGLAHVATALSTPSVVLFGPISPALWGPPPDRPWHRSLWAGGSGDPHAPTVDPGLLRITVDDVLNKLTALPATPRETPRSPFSPR